MLAFKNRYVPGQFMGVLLVVGYLLVVFFNKQPTTNHQERQLPIFKVGLVS
jgi:hypothetical protein